MSSSHSSSRRRNYGRRQRDIRRRGLPEMHIDLEGPDSWPRGSGWDHADRHHTDYGSGGRGSDIGGVR
jgi:hypothetical protein